MKYVIDWSPNSQDQLAEYWMMIVGLRQDITAAQARIDYLLATDPHTYGSLVSEGLYAIDVYPLRLI